MYLQEPLAAAWHIMWIIFQPILFGLTGALVDVRKMDGTLSSFLRFELTTTIVFAS